MRNTYRLLLAIHIVATVSVLGADLSLLALGIGGFGGWDPVTVYPAAHRIAAWLVMPLAALALGSGLLLAKRGGWGIKRQGWVTAKLVITLGLSVAVVFLLVPGLERAAASAAGRALDGADPAFAPLRLVVASAVASTLLAVNVALAVYKPGGRLPSTRVADSSPGSAASAGLESAANAHAAVP